MYFQVKITLKNNRYHTPKHPKYKIQLAFIFNIVRQLKKNALDASL
jgi:hypothetical protein